MTFRCSSRKLQCDHDVQVLDHLAGPYLNRCLDELARAGKHSLVYVAMTGRHF